MVNRFLPLGGGNEIGASSYFFEIEGTKLLIDAGIRLNSPIVFPRYNSLYEHDILDGLWELDAILITHGHLDHCGALPFVHSEAKRTPIYSTPQTRQIIELLLNDTSKLKNNRNNDTDIKLYNKLIVDETVCFIKEINFNQTIEIKNLQITFFSAGHILGASMIYIESPKINILVTGDFSSFDQFTVPKYSLPQNLSVDVLITESTYGYQELNITKTFKEERKFFISNISEVINNGGTVLIPAFAIGRTQELALIFKDYFKKNPSKQFPIFIGGLASEACLLYEKNGISIFDDTISRAPFSKKKLKNSLIIASSGMMLENTTSSRIASEIVESEMNMICFSGYLDEESPGKALSNLEKNKNQLLKINGKHLEVNADITNYRLSAHTNNIGIMQLVDQTKPKEIIFVHGFPKYGKTVNIFDEIADKNNSMKLHQSVNENIIYI